MEMLSKKQKILIIIGAIIIILVVGYYYFNSTKDVYNYESFETNEEVAQEENKEEEKTIIIHVAGAVLNPGIVEVKENARIDDVIKAAGGATENSDLNQVNLAYAVEDGQKIYIPSKAEITKNDEDIETVINGPGSESVLEGGENNTEGSLININTADETKLQELPGIGQSTALKIINYRKENGKFKSIEDIKNVSGIGDSKYESIKDLICV